MGRQIGLFLGGALVGLVVGWLVWSSSEAVDTEAPSDDSLSAAEEEILGYVASHPDELVESLEMETNPSHGEDDGTMGEASVVAGGCSTETLRLAKEASACQAKRGACVAVLKEKLQFIDECEQKLAIMKSKETTIADAGFNVTLPAAVINPFDELDPSLVADVGLTPGETDEVLGIYKDLATSLTDDIRAVYGDMLGDPDAGQDLGVEAMLMQVVQYTPPEVAQETFTAVAAEYAKGAVTVPAEDAPALEKTLRLVFILRQELEKRLMEAVGETKTDAIMEHPTSHSSSFKFTKE